MRSLPLFAAFAILSGCTVLRIEREPLQELAPEPAGEIRFLALRGENPDRLAQGYSLAVVKNFAVVGTYPSSSTGPTCAQGLAPGRYDISVSGPGISTHSTQVRVKPGQVTVVRLMVRNARQLAGLGDAALTAGKVVLYAVGAVVVAVVWVALEVLTADDDDDEDCDTSYKSTRKRTVHEGSVGTYRRKN